MVECPNGHENPDESAYCATCGEKLSTETAAPTPTPPPPPAGVPEPSDQGALAPATQPASRRDRTPVIVGGVALLLLLGILAFVLHPGGGHHTINGTVDIFQDVGFLAGQSYSTSNFSSANGTCQGSGGYSDLAPGVSVVVYSDTGDVLSTVPLGQGHDLQSNVGCEFTFTVPNLPDASSYSVEVSHRGKLTYTKEQLESNNWTVALSIGGP